VGDLQRAATDEDRSFVRDQIVVKLRQRIKYMSERRDTWNGPWPADRAGGQVEGCAGEDTAYSIPATSRSWLPFSMPQIPPAIAMASTFPKHSDELVSVEDDFGGRPARPTISKVSRPSWRANMNGAPALIAATQKPRGTNSQGVEGVAVLLDENGFSEASLRQASAGTQRRYCCISLFRPSGPRLAIRWSLCDAGRKRHTANHRQSELDGGPDEQWLIRIGRVLKEQPVGDPEILAIPCLHRLGASNGLDASSITG